MFANWEDINLIILDGSSENNFPKIEKVLCRYSNSDFSVRLLHDPDSDSFVKRLSEGSRLVETPYILLAADDDFYAFDWIDAACKILDSDSTIGVIYGNTLKFFAEIRV